MKQIILNSAHIVPGSGNSEFKYKFPSGNINIEQGQKLALANVMMYYSNENITEAYGNNRFSYKWIDGTVVDVVIPDGFYDIVALNNFLHFTMLQNLHYYTNSDGNAVWLLDLSANSTRYGFELNIWQTSDTIATTNSWTIPSGATWTSPVANTVPEFNVPNNGFKDLIGFNVGTYGTNPSVNNQFFLSQNTPQITPVSSYVMTCSLINNNYATNPNTLYCFAPNTTYGSQMSISVSEFAWIDTQAGQYNEFTVRFLDQDYRQLSIKDPSIIINLVISDPPINNQLVK